MAVVWLDSYSRPFWGVFGVKKIRILVKGNFLQFYPSRNAITWD